MPRPSPHPIAAQAALLLCALAAPACLPTFEEAECYADVDCPANLVCVATTCARPDANVPDRDAGTPDTGVDGGVEDAGAPDAAPPPDMGFADAGTPDSGPADTGPADTGPADAGTVDMGTPDAGVDLRLTPASTDFGVVRIGCPVPSRQVNLQNAGPTAIEITSLGSSQATSGEYTVTGRATPFVLAPAATESIDITYVPQNVGVDVGAVEVTYGNPAELLSSVLRAEGVVAGMRTDMFTQAAGPIDILFVVHDTAGMTPFQAQLASDLTFMTLILAFEGWDFQVGVTTADLSATGAQGALIGNPPFLTSQSANVEATLASRIMQGTGGALQVQGMEAARLALTAPLSTTGANMGFLRPAAALLVIFIGNEDDSSPMQVANYASFFNGLKGAGSDERVAANAIASTATACSVMGGSATYAGRYLGLAPLSGGVIDHICGNSYQTAVSTMPPIQRNLRFTLDAIADPMSVSVRVDGNAVPSNGGANWAFDVPTNSVVFTPAAAPALGVAVQVDYSISCN